MPTVVQQTIPEKIKQRRSQMLVHSCLYYDMDDSIIDDHTWQRWADELSELQNEYPQHCKIGFFDKEFVGWDGTSGYHLPLRDPWVRNKATQILSYSEKNCVQPEEDVIQYTGNLEEFM
jgi:hypothetical protein